MATFIGTKKNDHINGSLTGDDIIFGDPFTEGNFENLPPNAGICAENQFIVDI